MNEMISVGVWALKLYVYAQIIAAIIIFGVAILTLICMLKD